MSRHNNQQVRRTIRLLIFSVLTFMALSMTVTTPVMVAQDECLQCHESDGDTIGRSVHRFLDCTGCHQDIEGFPHPEGADFNKKESAANCASCHTGRIAESYQDSFHGKAVFLGSQKSASCSDCHGAHDVLRSDNPDSKVSDQNVAETCASCHGQAAPGFAQGNDHFLLTPTGAGAPMYYTAKFFIWLTIIIITGMVIHMELQLYRHLRNILDERKRR